MRELRTCGSVGGPDGQPSALPGKVLSATLAVAQAHPTINGFVNLLTLLPDPRHNDLVMPSP